MEDEFEYDFEYDFYLFIKEKFLKQNCCCENNDNLNLDVEVTIDEYTEHLGKEPSQSNKESTRREIVKAIEVIKESVLYMSIKIGRAEDGVMCRIIQSWVVDEDFIILELGNRFAKLLNYGLVY